MQTDRRLTIDFHFMYDSLSRCFNELERKFAERERERTVIDLIRKDSPVPVVVPRSIPRTLASVKEPAPAPGLFFVTILHLLMIFLFAWLGPVRRQESVTFSPSFFPFSRLSPKRPSNTRHTKTVQLQPTFLCFGFLLLFFLSYLITITQFRGKATSWHWNYLTDIGRRQV